MRYVLGIFGVFVLLLLVIILIFRDSPDTETNQTEVTQNIVLTDYESTPAVTQWTTRGEVTGDESRRAIRVSVSSSERVLEILEGYQENVISRSVYANNQEAYGVFLSSLQQAGFTSERQSGVSDERGVCPLGRRFVYRLQNGSEQVMRSWATSCSTREGTFAGNTRTVHSLFELQIPDYDTQVKGVEL